MEKNKTFRGLDLITSESCLLKPIAVAGNPSVTKLTQSSWTWVFFKKKKYSQFDLAEGEGEEGCQKKRKKTKKYTHAKKNK